MYVNFVCTGCGNTGGRFRVEDELVQRDELNHQWTMPCPTCHQTAIATPVHMTVPPRDDDVQAVLEAWPEVRRMVLALIGPDGNLFDQGTMERLRVLVESLPNEV